jgi:DNA-binding transcriptional MocR family regulator
MPPADQRPSTQLAACNFIREGHYHRHVRRMRQIYQRNMEIYTCWLREFFRDLRYPPERRLYAVGRAAGAGGYGLRREAAVPAENPVAPGSLFSASGKYRNCLRINCALPPTDKHKEVMVQLGMAVKVAMEWAPE